MYDSGYKQIYNMDISEVVINQMKQRNKLLRPQMICTPFLINYLGETMDVRSMTYQANFFDFILDKSTIDALLCGDSAYMNVALMLKVYF